MPVLARNLARKHGAHSAVDVADRHVYGYLFASFEGGLREFDQPVVERTLQSVVLFFDVVARHFCGHIGLVEDAAEVQPTRLPVLDALFRVEQVGATDELVDCAHAQFGHDLASLFSHEEEEIDHVLGLALELAAQHRILRGHADRTRVEMALPHHDAAFGHQGRGREAELVRAQKRADHHVATGFHLPVDLDCDAAAQAVQHESLLSLGQAKLPRRACVLDRRPGRSAGAAVVPRNRHVVGLGFRHARRHRAYAVFGHELHADRSPGIGVLEVVDQLCKILDRIDVMVRRRADELDPGCRIAQQRDVFRNLLAGQLPAFAGFRALRHLDLDLFGGCEVLRGHAEAPRRDLLDLRFERIAFLEDDVAFNAVLSEPRREGLSRLHGGVTVAILAAFAGIRFAADPVHRNG